MNSQYAHIPHYSKWAPFHYLTKSNLPFKASKEAIPDNPFLWALTNCHCTSTTIWHSLIYISYDIDLCLCLFIRSKALWGPSLMATSLFYWTKYMAGNKCTLNWSYNHWRNSWTHGSTLVIIKFQNKNSYKFCVILPYNFKSSLRK